MKVVIAILLALIIPISFAEQILEQPGSMFGKNYDEKNDPTPEPKQWGWNDDTDYDLSMVNTVDRFKGPSTSSGWRIHINKGTPIRIDNDIWKIKEPPDVNSPVGAEPNK